MTPAELHWQYRRPIFATLAFVVLLPAGAGTFQAEKVEPAKGVFLVAKPKISGTFGESVVLLLAHEEVGTLGVIINRVTDVPLSEVLPDLKEGGKESHRLFFGGPVAMNGLIFLFRSTKPPKEASHVMGDVYFSGELKVLEELLERKKGSSELHLFLGHAGWGPGQLQWELGRGDWELVLADTETVFEKDPDTIWPELMGPVSRQVAE